MASYETIMGGNSSEPSGGNQNARDKFSPESGLLTVLAEAIDCPDDLKNLCLVNKAFDHAFYPKLYRRLSFTVDGSLLQRLQGLLQTTKISVTQALSFRPSMNGGGAGHVDFANLLPVLGQLLRKIPALDSFCWVHPSGVNILGLITHVAISEEDVLSKLRCLIISPTDLATPVGLPLANELQMPLNLRSLTTLTLINLEYSRPSKHIQQWFSDCVGGIANLLGSSPMLDYLELSVARPFFNQNEEFAEFFPRICENYRERGFRPLQLKGLNLGLGFMLVSAQMNGEAAYLRHLTRMQLLDELHMVSEGIEAWDPLTDGMMYTAWGTVSQQNTPSLEYLHIDEIDMAGCNHLLSGEVSYLLRNVELEIDEEMVYADDDDLEEQLQTHGVAFTNVADLFSEELERQLETRSLRIAVDPSVFEESAPTPWRHMETLALASRLPESDVFAEIPSTFLGPVSCIQVLSLQFDVPPMTATDCQLFDWAYIDTLQLWTARVASCSLQLREISVTFHLAVSSHLPRGDMYCWRVVRMPVASGDVGWLHREADAF